jgi:hypothetical protein
MHRVPLNGSVVRVNPREMDILAEVWTTIDAKEAVSAGHARLDSNTIPFF